MQKIFKKDEMLTLPNILSFFRIILLPVIALMYFKQNYTTAIILLIVSGITDILDGYIARKFNLVSDFGKILDPIADKLTQWTLLICLSAVYKVIIPVVIIFTVKEIFMALLGYIILKRKNLVNSSKWYGKLNTVIIYSTIFLLILLPDVSEFIVDALVICCILTIVISLLLYTIFYNKILSHKTEKH